MADLLNDEDLARARRDPAFRQRLLADYLDRLLDALNRMRRSGNNSPESAQQIREGVEMAVALADRLHRVGSPSRVA
jgi:hypothetical protein